MTISQKSYQHTKPNHQQQSFHHQEHPVAVSINQSVETTMSDLAQRLQKIQRPEKPVLVDINNYTREELSEMKIKFGSTHVGRTFSHMWEVEQGWVKWFLERYSESTKLDHRLFVRYAELQIKMYEEWGGTVPVISEKAQTQSKQIKAPPMFKTAPKAKAKSQAAGTSSNTQIPEFLVNDMAQEEEFEFLQAEWEAEQAVKQVSADPDPEVQSLQTRMLNLENALQQVIVHLQNQDPKTPANPEQP